MPGDKWDGWFLGLAGYFATASKDPSTKCGCVLVDAKRRVVGGGYNGFARGCSDAYPLYQDRARKYRRVIHAEVNAVLFAAQPLCGCTAYTVPFQPCAPCAALLIQAGVTRVVAPPAPPELAVRWADDIAEAQAMFREAGVEFVTLSGGLKS